MRFAARVAGRVSVGFDVASTVPALLRSVAWMSSFGPRGDGKTLIVTLPIPAVKLKKSTSFCRSITPLPLKVVTPSAVLPAIVVAVPLVLP